MFLIRRDGKPVGLSQMLAGVEMSGGSDEQIRHTKCVDTSHIYDLTEKMFNKMRSSAGGNKTLQTGGGVEIKETSHDIGSIDANVVNYMKIHGLKTLKPETLIPYDLGLKMLRLPDDPEILSQITGLHSFEKTALVPAGQLIHQIDMNRINKIA